jgi:chaperonin GroES
MSARYNTLTLHVKVYIAHMKKDKQTLNISLLADRALILPASKKGEQKTASGIILSKKDEDQKVEMGTVVAVGNGRRNNDGVRVPLDVKVGDKVYFKRGYDVEEITLEGTEYVLLSEVNIYAVIGA